MSTRSKRSLSAVNTSSTENDSKKIKYEVEELTNDDTLSDYEKVRLANIQKNQDFLVSLGIADYKPESSLVNKKESAVRGSVKKTGKPKPVIPTRRSGRVTIEKLSSEIKELEEGTGKADDEEIRLKKAELETLIATKKEGSFGSYEPQTSEFVDERERITDEQISMIPPTNASEDEEGRDIILSLKEVQKKTTKSPSKSKDDTYNKKVSNLSVKEHDFAKVAEARITSIWAHPSQDKLIVAAGDKTGCIGIWDVNTDVNGDKNGGVYRYNAHASNIISLFSNANNPSRLYSGSYDGTIRFLDFNKEAFVLGFESPETIYDVMFKDISFIDDKAYIATKGGDVNFVDCRVGNKKYTWSYDTDCSLNSIHIHPTNSNYLITAGLKGITQVHDIRNGGKKWKPLVRMEEHSKSVSACYCSPDGNYLVSVSLDDTIKVWKDFLKPKYQKPFVCRHDNHTGRWLSVFKPSWDPKHPHSFAVGSMEKVRNIEVFQPVGGDKVGLSLVSKLKGGYLNSVCSRICFHPTLDAIIGGNSSGKVYILR